MNECDVDRLYRAHRGHILHYCRVHLNDPREAEDVAQEVWVRALAALRRGETPRNPAAWLTTIAKRLVIDTYRARDRYWRAVGEDLTLDRAQTQPDGQISPFEAAVGAEWVRCIQMALPRLTEAQETALRLDLDGCSGADMARCLGVSVGAAKAVLHRGRVQLRAELEGMRA